MKKLLSSLMVLMLICVAFFPASAEQPAETRASENHLCGDFAYIILDDGTAEITKYTGQAEKLTIPDKLDQLTVTGIGDWAFAICHSLTAVSIPDSLIRMGDNPFAYCENLKNIIVPPDHPSLTVIDGVLFSKPDNRIIFYPPSNSSDHYSIPNGIQIIGVSAFYGCSSLTAVTIPDTVISIGEKAFYCCSKLTAVNIPDSVTSIGKEAFLGCSSLKAVTLPDSVLHIGDDAFFNCFSLKVMILPDSVTSIGKWAFCGCSSLTAITLPNSITGIEDMTFAGCSSLMAVTIPEGVTSIWEMAFSGCDSLTTVTLPASVTRIEPNAFWQKENRPPVFIVPKDSYAEQFCKENGYRSLYPEEQD